MSLTHPQWTLARLWAHLKIIISNWKTYSAFGKILQYVLLLFVVPVKWPCHRRPFTPVFTTISSAIQTLSGVRPRWKEVGLDALALKASAVAPASVYLYLLLILTSYFLLLYKIYIYIINDYLIAIDLIGLHALHFNISMKAWPSDYLIHKY